MKSLICTVSEKEADRNHAMDEVEKSAVYAGLDRKEMLQLRLLAEELFGMMREITGVYDASFWLEADGNAFELHMEAKTKLDRHAKEELMSVSKNGENIVARGVMGKIRSVVEACLEQEEYTGQGRELPFGVIGSSRPYGGLSGNSLPSVWSLIQYRDSHVKSGDAWDELEKSIVANLADDVLIGVSNKKAEVIIKKTFQHVYGLNRK